MYTTYFAKLRKLPAGVVPIAICAKVPDWFKGLQYRKLIPPYGAFSVWKEDHNDGVFSESYTEEVLKKLHPMDVYKELIQMANTHEVALVCYEKSDSFCHRHLVAKWLNEYGFKCEEFKEG